MSKYTEHRLYRYLSEPMRIVGLTIDELVLGMGGFFGAIFMGGSWSATTMIGSIFAVVLLKKIKKKLLHGQTKSFLYWNGFIPKPSKTFTKFFNREYRR